MTDARAAHADETPDVGGWLKLPQAPANRRQHFDDGAKYKNGKERIMLGMAHHDNAEYDKRTGLGSTSGD